MAKLSELREIIHTNKIRGYSHYNKKQLIVLLEEKKDYYQMRRQNR